MLTTTRRRRLGLWTRIRKYSWLSPLLDTKTYPNAVISENSDVVNTRAEEVAVQRMFINTSSVGDRRWSSHLMEEDWHSNVRPFFLGLMTKIGRTCFRNYVEMRKELDAIHEQKEENGVYHGEQMADTIDNQAQVRQDFWNKHLKNPALALPVALKRVEQAGDEVRSSAAGSRVCAVFFASMFQKVTLSVIFGSVSFLIGWFFFLVGISERGCFFFCCARVRGLLTCVGSSRSLGLKVRRQRIVEHPF